MRDKYFDNRRGYLEVDRSAKFTSKKPKDRDEKKKSHKKKIDKIKWQ